MKILPALTSLAACALLTACASPNFYPHESRDNSYVGKGGSRFNTEGMDVWFIGEPDRKYAILGYIESPMGAVIDESHKTISSDILKKAREVRADALIEVVTQTQSDRGGMVWGGGMYGGGGYRGGYSGIGFGFPVSEQRSARYTAIKYLD